MAAQACLTELDLSDNAFGPAGVEALVGFLTSPSCFSLKVVRFNNNGLGSKGGTVSGGSLVSCLLITKYIILNQIIYLHVLVHVASLSDKGYLGLLCRCHVAARCSLCLFFFVCLFVCLFVFQLLSKALLDCHEEANKTGQRLALEVFVAGRNRLENDGATALSQLFEVQCRYTYNRIHSNYRDRNVLLLCTQNQMNLYGSICWRIPVIRVKIFIPSVYQSFARILLKGSPVIPVSSSHPLLRIYGPFKLFSLSNSLCPCLIRLGVVTCACFSLSLHTPTDLGDVGPGLTPPEWNQP